MAWGHRESAWIIQKEITPDKMLEYLLPFVCHVNDDHVWRYRSRQYLTDFWVIGALCFCLCLSVSLSLSLFLCLSVCLSLSLSLYVYLSLSSYLTVSPFLLYLCLSVCLSASNYLSVCFHFSLSHSHTISPCSRLSGTFSLLHK